MKSVNLTRKWFGIKYKLVDIFKSNRKTTFFLLLFAIIGLLTGIFAAINFSRGAVIINFNDFSISSYLSGGLGTWDLFFSRLFSTTVVTIIIFVSSISIFLIPVNFIVMMYRAYLLGLNCTIIILFNGLGGIISCLLIILPCQIISLFLITMFCSFAWKKAYAKRYYGSCDFKLWHKFFIFFFLLLIINLIETLLLFIFSSRIILVI